MAAKVLHMTASFNHELAGFLAQAAIIPQTSQSVLVNMSGVTNLQVSSPQEMRVGKGIAAVRQFQIKVPTTGNNDQDRIRGSAVARAAINPAFKLAVDASLLIQTGVPSSLSDIGPAL